MANDDAETGGANNHRQKVGADHAVIIARKFAGFEFSSNEPPALLGECLSIGTVSIMTVEALNKLLFAVTEHSYSLDTIKSVFCEIETPQSKLKRIEGLSKPLDQVDWIKLLNQIWESHGADVADGVAIKTIWMNYRYKMNGVEFDHFKAILEAIRALAYPLVQFVSDQEVYLIQSPENIATRIRKKLSIA